LKALLMAPASQARSPHGRGLELPLEEEAR
jgi:hypothetical protein